MLSLINALTSMKRLAATQTSLRCLLQSGAGRRGGSRRSAKHRANRRLRTEALEKRALLTTIATSDGGWFDDDTWSNGVPDESQRAIIGSGVTVELNGADHFAKELVIHGDLVVPEEVNDPTQVEDGRMKLYFNGGLVGDAPGSQLWSHNNGTGIGGIHNNTKTHHGIVRGRNARDADYEGLIDTVATHNRALSSQEIDTLFAVGREQIEGIPQEGIASLWTFQQDATIALDEAEGDRRADNARLLGDAAANGALVLDGEGDYAKVGNSRDLSIGRFQEKTISLWFKADHTDGVQMIYEQGGHIRGLNIYLDGDTLHAGGWNTPRRESGWQGDWITQPGIIAGQWNHVALTLDANAVAEADKSLTTRWVHVNSGGEFIVGSEDDRYDQGTFTLNLTGTDKYASHEIETHMGGMQVDGMHMASMEMDGMAVPGTSMDGMAMGTMTVTDNDGFLMTGMGGRVQFYGEEKLSFTKLSATAEAGDTTITIENLIERNYDKGAIDGDEFVTTAADDGSVNWEVGDEIVIASSSYDYAEEDVRTITAITDNGDGTSTLTLNEALEYKHYGEIEVYGEADNAAPGTTPASQTHEIDMRAEVALLSRNIKIQGLDSQDTDAEFGDRANLQTEDRIRANGLSNAEANVAPDQQVANGVGGHIMFMPGSGQITVDGVQLEGMGQASQKGRYPIHWHMGGDRTGDVLRNSSVTNSNNRGVTIHGTSNLLIEGVVLHDIHGHGFFFEDAVETGNELVSNIAFGVHQVGGGTGWDGLGKTDPFVVDTHDSVRQADSRFKSSAAFWITNPTNTFVGNISAGTSGTGFWYAIPRTALGDAAKSGDYDGYNPIYAEFGQFDHNASHSTPVGLNFDMGSDIEDARPEGFPLPEADANRYSPREGSLVDGAPTTNHITGFTNYKSIDSAIYHRGEGNSILFNDIKVADSYNAVWSVFATSYTDSLFVGHSRGNADAEASVGGPRLYDDAALYTNTHFAGFAHDNAYTFQVEGSSFGPNMYHSFQGTSFEDDGTYGNLSHAVSDFPNRDVPQTEHDLGQPARWIKGVLDLDGTLTAGVGGGAGFSIVPSVDFLADGDDFQPEGWDAWLTDDIYTRVHVSSDGVDGQPLFSDDVTGEPLVRFTARDGDSIDVTGGQEIGSHSWTQVAAKTESDGYVDGTITVEFLRNGVPTTPFDLQMTNQDGDLPNLNPEIKEKVDNARIVVKVVAAGNHVPSNWTGVTEVASETELREATSGIVYYRDDQGNLYLNTGITSDWLPITLTPGESLQTTSETRTVEYGTTIQAEEFDNGLDGIAYHDSDAINTLGPSDRDTGVDATSSYVGDIQDGEWLEYTAEIVASAYNIGVNVSSTVAGGQVRVLAATSNSAGYLKELGTVDVPNTEGTFTTVWLEGVDLAPVAGRESVIRLEFVGGGFEVDSLQFAAPAQTAYDGLTEDRVITAAAGSTTRIELEQYDEGGQGVAYYDTTAGNSAGEFRSTEDVDATDTLVTNAVFDGEWLEYTTDIEAGVYDITLKKAWNAGDDAAVKLFIGDSNSSTELTELGEFALAGADLITLENVDLSPWAGQGRVIRIEIVGNWMGIDYLDFASVSS